MSRPPTMQAPQENSYNGGLIDFHDSVIRADLGQALYAQQMAAQNQYQSTFPTSAGAYATMPVASGMPSPMTYGPYAGNGMPGPMQAMYPQQGSIPSTNPAPSMMMAPGQPQCIAGPPAFLHLHGKVYAPVEDSTVDASAASEPQARATVKEPATLPSGKTFDRVVEKRIEQKVDEFISKNFKGKSAGNKDMKKKNGGKDDFGLKDLNSAMRSRIRGY